MTYFLSSWFIRSLYSVLETFSQTPKVWPQPMLHDVSRCLIQIRFYRGYSYPTVRIRVHTTFVDPSLVWWLSETLQEARDICFAFSGYISADSDAKFYDLYESFRRKWKWRLADKAKKAKTQSKLPSRTFEDHYRVNYFLPFIDHIISHLNSRFPQELKAIIYDNYMVPALENNIRTLQTQFLILTLTVPKCSCHFKAIANITSRFLCMWEVFLGSSVPQALV